MRAEGWRPSWADPFPATPTWSLAEELRALSDGEIDRILGTLTNEERAALQWTHHGFWLRPDVRKEGALVGTGQERPPGDHIYVVFQGGRAAGKSYACMVAFADDAHELGPDFVGVVLCENDEEARSLIDDPKSGMRAILPPWKRPAFNPSVEGGLLTFPSGAVARVMSAEKPSKARSGNFNRILIDDPPKFGPNGKAVFDTLMRAFRLQGAGLRAYIATTPPGNSPPPRCPELLEHVLAAQFDPARGGEWVYSISESDANLSNLDKDTKRVLREYEGSPDEEVERRGIYVKGGGPRTFAGVEFARPDSLPEVFDVVTISIDPADSSSTKACEVGITAQGLAGGTAIVLEDVSGLLDSMAWPELAHELFDRWESRARRVRFVLEINRGTKDAALLKMCEMNRRQRARPDLPAFAIRQPVFVTSRVGKADRAAPLVELYRQRRVRHVAGGLHDLEAQLRRMHPGSTTGTDRADAVVHGLLDLFGLLDLSQAVALGGGDAANMPGAFGASTIEAIGVGAPPAGAFAFSAPGLPTAGAFGRSSF
jgi:phage terminase large subunit-like protein